MNSSWFEAARYGLIVHYGLYSLLGRGEWVMNREAISRDKYAQLAREFTAEAFDAEALCALAVRAGMRYIVFTTMHHEGFRLYRSELSDFNSHHHCGRDLTAEIVEAARRHGLRIALYHSLNNWMDQPDAVDALEDSDLKRKFIDSTFERIRELVTRYNPIDVLWYDGWWPFNAEGWEAERMNAMVREIQPHILFNGRNGLPGDFATPEGHLTAPAPWRPWEGCITMNNSWGFHSGDHEWKTAPQVVDLLATCAAGNGNLLLNVGPRGDGSIPHQSSEVLEQVGQWIRVHGEAIYGTDAITMDLHEKGHHRGDWCNHGPITMKGNSLYLLVRRWPGRELVLSGLECEVRKVHLLGDGDVSFLQNGDKLVVSGLPRNAPDPICPVLHFECDRLPSLYLTGGLRVPNVPHPHYDPCPSDLAQGRMPGA
jgi:alpha-L-fucosidase